MTAADGKTMTIGISVDGDEVAAYACNGTDDEAWFFGNQTDGRIDIKSRFRDTLNAEFDGTNVEGDLNMNGVAYQFTAKPVTGEAGMYTAELDGTRASWVVRENGSAVGVQFTNNGDDDINVFELNDARFRAEVRNRRLLQQAQQIERLQNGRMSSKINGKDVTPDTGQRKFPPRLTTETRCHPTALPVSFITSAGPCFCIIQNQNLLARQVRA